MRKVPHILRVYVVLLFENSPSFRDKLMEAAGWIKKCVEEPGLLGKQIVVKCAVYDRTIRTIC